MESKSKTRTKIEEEEKKEQTIRNVEYKQQHV